MAQFYVNRREIFRLRDLDEELARQLQEREEIDDQDRDAARRIEELAEFQDAPFLQAPKDGAHVLAYRELLAGNLVMLRHAGAVQQAAPRFREVLGIDVRQALGDGLLDPYRDRDHVAPDLRQVVERLGGFLHLLVLEQPAHQLRTRIVLDRLGRRRPGQEQARLDRHQHRGHYEVLGGELQVLRAHDLDVLQILPRERRHRDVENVEVFLADQIEQQVQRT